MPTQPVQTSRKSVEFLNDSLGLIGRYTLPPTLSDLQMTSKPPPLVVDLTLPGAATVISGSEQLSPLKEDPLPLPLDTTVSARISPATRVYTPSQTVDDVESIPFEEFMEFVSSATTSKAQHDTALSWSTTSASIASSVSVVECAGCTLHAPGSTDTANGMDGEYIACDECGKWSHVSCIERQFGLAPNFKDIPWTCPMCQKSPMWSDALYVTDSDQSDTLSITHLSDLTESVNGCFFHPLLQHRPIIPPESARHAIKRVSLTHTSRSNGTMGTYTQKAPPQRVPDQCSLRIMFPACCTFRRSRWSSWVRPGLR